MMRVITGSARGRRLETLPGEDVTRPTAESVKEALFSMIQFEIEDKRVLDYLPAPVSWVLKPCPVVQLSAHLLKIIKKLKALSGQILQPAVFHPLLRLCFVMLRLSLQE